MFKPYIIVFLCHFRIAVIAKVSSKDSLGVSECEPRAFLVTDAWLNLSRELRRSPSRCSLAAPRLAPLSIGAALAPAAPWRRFVAPACSFVPCLCLQVGRRRHPYRVLSHHLSFDGRTQARRVLPRPAKVKFRAWNCATPSHRRPARCVANSLSTICNKNCQGQGQSLLSHP